ncbi:MAG: hypothetical protein A2849_03610 [Candidatus Taylorbacteria bacterium RIFCSPHIGHO2_01_FULL_51_15]|uniref:Uncharacterized protein n=1 Tax=Candidatus Taylorbacteria bacterium RIFCSPHIGHO2_01_FULL_51_15 TaxID=1802304 RepID=A0A1G2MD37_9BACT|nr:MAG: hypothetical protein A2849_03610 [Candidatus Taylorbacteria bacterium RIFCSPHIGHO2_01_FULL_51_15]
MVGIVTIETEITKGITMVTKETGEESGRNLLREHFEPLTRKWPPSVRRQKEKTKPLPEYDRDAFDVVTPRMLE